MFGSLFDQKFQENHIFDNAVWASMCSYLQCVTKFVTRIHDFEWKYIGNWIFRTIFFILFFLDLIGMLFGICNLFTFWVSALRQVCTLKRIATGKCIYQRWNCMKFWFHIECTVLMHIKEMRGVVEIANAFISSIPIN